MIVIFQLKLALPLLAVYNNHQLRKIQYRSLIESNQKADILKTAYFHASLTEDRTAIKQKLAEYNMADEIQDIYSNDFDDKLIDIMKTDLGDRKGNQIAGDFSYNISYIPEFKQVFYNDYIKPLYETNK